jgi:hypothetical protein
MHMRHNRLKTKLFVAIACTFLFLFTQSALFGEGIDLSGEVLTGEILGNERITVGVFQGDPAVSLIEPSGYLSLDYTLDYNSEYFYTRMALNASDVLLNWEGQVVPNLFVNSGYLELVGKLKLQSDWSIGLGIVPNYVNALYTGSFDPRVNIGTGGIGGGVDLGLWSKYTFLPEEHLLGGISENYVVSFENIQNEKLSRLMPYPMNTSVWIKYLSGVLPDSDIYFMYNKMYNTVGVKLSEKLSLNVQVYCESNWITTKNSLYQDRAAYKAGSVFSIWGIDISPELSFIHSNGRHNEEISDELAVRVTASMPLFTEKHGVALDVDLQTRPDYKERKLSGEYKYTNAAEYSEVYWEVHWGVRNLSYYEFVEYLSSEINDPNEAIFLAKTLGWNLVYYNYNHFDSDATFWEDTLSNSASDQDIFEAVKYSLINLELNPITTCRGIARYVAKMVNHASVDNVEAYPVVVSNGAEGHLVSLITTPKQIYIADYMTITPTQTQDVEMAFQIYQNLYSYPQLFQYICDDNGALLDRVSTPDGRLFMKTLTVQKGMSWDEQIKDLAVRMSE